MQVGYVFDPFMTRHDHPYDDHPECPDRILAIFNELLNQKLIQKMKAIKSRNATIEELKFAHNDKYINDILKMHPNTINNSYNSIYANEFSIDCALLAAGSTLELTKNVINGKISSGIAIVRPPGHHCCRDKAMGFCFFNNIAIASIYARNNGQKVAIVDFDIHENNGVSNIVRGEKDILAISIHRYDNGRFYPGGKSGDIQKDATSNIKNYPFNNIIAGDKEYLDVFVNKIIPELKNFNPDIIMVSAGFDAAEGDPLGGYKVTPFGYGQMTKLMKKICPKMCLVLEGGYNLNSISNQRQNVLKFY